MYNLLIYNNLNLKRNHINFCDGINPFLGNVAMFVTQDFLLKYFFRKKTIFYNNLSIPKNCSIILAPTHRSRWDGLILTMAVGRRVTKKDCHFMVTNSEMRGIQGWFLKRLGCFSINQISPSLSVLRYAVNLIASKRQLVVFPEGRINKYGKKIPLKQGLYRLARLAAKKTQSVIILPIGIAYSNVPPIFMSKVSLCFGEPLKIEDNATLSIDDFNMILNEKMIRAEKKALKHVGR